MTPFGPGNYWKQVFMFRDFGIMKCFKNVKLLWREFLRYYRD